MKVEQINKKPEFEPISITITFESEEELAGMYNIFNHSAILDASNDTGTNVYEMHEFMSALNNTFGSKDRCFEEFATNLKKQIVFNCSR